MTSHNPTSVGQADLQQALEHYHSGRWGEALVSFNRAITLQPDVPFAYFYRGIVLHELQRFENALASYDRALALLPDFPEGYSNRGNTLLALNKLDDALASYDRAIALKADYMEAFNNRGMVLLKLNRLDDALASFDRAIALNHDNAFAHSNRGNALERLGRLDDALASYDRVIALRPDYAVAYRARGMALTDAKRLHDALASIENAIALNPAYVDAYWSKSHLKLLMGDYEQGWTLQEWRLKRSNFNRPFHQRRWLGNWNTHALDEPKTILIHAEAGLGDTIQYCRYLPMMKELQLRVILEVPSPLVTLMSTLDATSSVVEKGSLLPDFDQHCPIGSLPLAFKTTLATIPATIPYLYADPDRVTIWHKRLGNKTKPRIGLVWSGQHNRHIDLNPARRRSIPLKLFQPLLQLPFEFHSLQKDVRPDDAVVLSQSEHLHDHRDDLNEFADTAALIKALDLVVSIDTSVAHLAGALGHNVCVLLPFSTDYRWTLTGTTTPWYPTATLFRQPTIGDWESVVSEVAAQLRDFKWTF